jgi:threonine/homoserine/homoserine lactone efflux protein
MSGELWLVFIIVSALVDLTPGLTITAVVSVAISRGFGEGLKAVVGALCGNFAIAGFAVASVFLSYHLSASFLETVSLAGALYLIYIGLKPFVILPDLLAFLRPSRKSVETLGRSSAFLAGLVTPPINPGCYFYWLALFPQFQPSAGPTLPHSLALVLTDTLINAMTLSLYAYIASRIRHLFIREKYRHLLDWLSGGALLMVGGWVLFKHLRFS